MYLLRVIFLFLPAGIANMVPPFAAIIFPKHNQPLDFNLKFRGQRVFGDHKTIRGLLSGVIAGAIIFLLQKYLYQSSDSVKSFALIDYGATSSLLGLSMGFGALAGDAVKSFAKRQVGIKPGLSWFPWDQIDWVIGSTMAALPFMSVSLNLFMTYLFSGLALHLLVKGIGFIMKMNKSYI